MENQGVLNTDQVQIGYSLYDYYQEKRRLQDQFMDKLASIIECKEHKRTNDLTSSHEND